jgi:hypothetical protein
MRAPAVSLGLFATNLDFTLAASPKQFAIQERSDVSKDILNGFEVMPANPLLGGDEKRSRKRDAKSEQQLMRSKFPLLAGGQPYS